MLPSTMKALILNEDSSITLSPSHPTPSPTPGSLVVRVLATQANPNLVRMLSADPSAHVFTQPRPLVPGGLCLARVAALPDDAVALKEGQLVAVDNFVRGRDDPSVQILRGMHDGESPESKKLHLAWRDGTYAEYCSVPLENAFALDEARLCKPVSDGGLGYEVNDLVHLLPAAVPYGGLRSIGVRAGETVIVSPATGLFSGSAIVAALAMGADVIAASRSESGLGRVKTVFPSIKTVRLTGDVGADTAAITAASGTHPPDAFIDLSPPEATGSSGVTACMLAVRSYGRIVLMGGRGDAGIPIPWAPALYRNLTIKGGFMYEREDVEGLVRLLETGRIKLGGENGYEVSGAYELEEWDKAAEAAVEKTAFGRMVVLNP